MPLLARSGRSVTFSPQTGILWLNPSGGLEGTLGGSGVGLAGAGGMAGALQSAQAAAAERAAPARARGECVFAIISIITTS